MFTRVSLSVHARVCVCVGGGGGDIDFLDVVGLWHGGGSNHTCPPLDCLKRWQSDHTWPQLDCLRGWQSDHTWHHFHRPSELAQTNWKVQWEAQTDMCQWLTSTLENSCGCTALDVAKQTATAGQTDWREKRPSQVACVSKDLKRCLGSLVHYLRAQSRGHYTIDRLEERGVERGSARQSSFKRHERAIFNQTNIGTIPKAASDRLLWEGIEHIWAFTSA